ncbi:zinc ribbon domain-containing protein [Anaerolineae bacterium CFX9]|nr:zinc ribbon domain-containing protein [Anaerolineae bacterium CFX9]
MPVYTYRREDGTTFDYRQKFSDDPLTVDPATGQRVVRIVQAAGVIFKGSGFYINDSKGASKSSANGVSKTNGSSEAASGTPSTPAPEAKSETAPSTSAAAD